MQIPPDTSNRVFTRPLLPGGSHPSSSWNSVCLSVITSIFPIWGLQIMADPTGQIYHWKEDDIRDDDGNDNDKDTHKDEDNDKDKMLKRPIICYIFKKWGVQGYQISHQIHQSHQICQTHQTRQNHQNCQTHQIITRDSTSRDGGALLTKCFPDLLRILFCWKTERFFFTSTYILICSPLKFTLLESSSKLVVNNTKFMDRQMITDQPVCKLLREL